MPPHLNEYLIKARRSTDDEINQKNSLEYQVEQCTKYARERGLPIADLTISGFCEHGVIQEKHTAYKTADLTIDSKGRVIYEIERPKFQQLVALLAQGKVRGIIALCWDRLSRNPHDDAVIKNLIARGVDVRFVQASYDKTSAGALHMDIDGMFAAHYSRVTSEKVRSTNAKLRAEGRCTYGAPVGYLNVGTDNKPLDPERAPLIKRLFDLYATGTWSIQQLAEWAKTHGLTSKPSRRRRSHSEVRAGVENTDTPVSRPITRTGIASILRSPFYIGRIRAGNDWLPGLHKPLIDQRLFYQVQRLLKERCVGLHYETMPFFLYRGIISCPCGRRYSPYEQKGHFYYRASCQKRCQNSRRNLREDQIDLLVAEILGSLRLTEDEAKRLQKDTARMSRHWEKERDAARKALSARRSRIERDLAYLVDNKTALLREGVYTMAGLAAEEARLTDERDKVEKDMRTEQEAPPVEMAETLINILELATLAKDSYLLADSEQKHAVLTNAFLELVVTEGSIAKVRAKEGIDILLKRGDGLGRAPNNLIHELPKLYHAALQSRSVMDLIGSTSKQDSNFL